MQELAQDQGIVVTFMPAGPLLEYNPAKVKTPPTTAEELLAWCKANPNRLIYARPANSGPGRTFIMGLPYILGDKDPKDPVNGWEKTWAYLKELNSCIEYYPTGTGADDEGARRRVARHDGHDDGLGHQSARPRHRAEGLQGRADEGHDVGQRRALHGRAQGRGAGQAGGDPRRDGVHADAGSAGVHVRQGLLLSRPGGEERAAVDGAEGEPGCDQGIRPPRVRRWLAEFPHTQSLEPRRRSTRSGSGTSRSARRRRSNHATARCRARSAP